MAFNFDIQCEQCATYLQQVQWILSGVPPDLTGFTAKMQVRQNPSEPVIVMLSTDNGCITTGSNGIVILTIPATTTTTLAPGYYEYDCFLSSPGGYGSGGSGSGYVNVVTRFLFGKFNVIEAITHE
jgi:hypothetical protein